MKKILVTGGAGFIGSNLCKRLLSEGAYVICMDNLYTGRMANLEGLLGHPAFEFHNHNIIEPLDEKEFCGIEEIYNLACPASPPYYQKSPTYTIKTCVIGMMNMLELAKRNNAKIMQFSTSEVCGKERHVKNICWPRHPALQLLYLNRSLVMEEKAGRGKAA